MLCIHVLMGFVYFVRQVTSQRSQTSLACRRNTCMLQLYVKPLVKGYLGMAKWWFPVEGWTVIEKQTILVNCSCIVPFPHLLEFCKTMHDCTVHLHVMYTSFSF